ncbi:Highly divergent homeobox [Triplophysa tibetana]|uniref:Highly divergent homeobox n=1 Tax=Triplophysa tibetana TaxID=1572043 RepID=A0A5A9NGJ5_9TELE|nr:Highly divergent homeobox [Triplophysa tibetana]
MNLRSVFTAEQQRILERYYENGMTNQSKICFQLILQCAQDTKLDFSVVRRYLGDYRKQLAKLGKLTSGTLTISTGGHQGSPLLFSLYTNNCTAKDSSVKLLNFADDTSIIGLIHIEDEFLISCILPYILDKPHIVENYRRQVLSISSERINSSVYCLQRHILRLKSLVDGTHRVSGLETKFDTDTSQKLSNICPTLQLNMLAPHAKLCQLVRKQVGRSKSVFSCSGLRQNVTYAWAPVLAGEIVGTESNPSVTRLLPPQASCSSSSSSPLSSSPLSTGSGPNSDIILTGSGAASHLPFSKTSQDKETIKKQLPDMSAIFSIAMETGDADDEYLREEELANMGPQIQLSKSNSGSICQADGVRSSDVLTQSTTIFNESNNSLFEDKGYQTNSSLTDTSSHSSFSLRPRSQPSSGIPSFKFKFYVNKHETSCKCTSLVTSNMSAPWLHTNSRKRTLQDRTQFSDRDVYALKRYWDNGMTSLGLVCREKISAAANKLNVDSEIIKTWIGNRRRKYRLMGIEIPPPKGGPAMFSNQTEAYSPQILEDEDEIPGLTEGSEDNGIVSLCLSDDGASDCYETINDYVNDESDRSSAGGNVVRKIEITDEEDNGDILNAEMEQLQTFLEFKNEEVQFLEEELHNQKRKFSKLQSFTRSLLIAVKNNDQKKQEDLLASVRHKEELGLCMENHREFGIEATSTKKDSSMSEEYNTGPVRL